MKTNCDSENDWERTEKTVLRNTEGGDPPVTWPLCTGMRSRGPDGCTWRWWVSSTQGSLLLATLKAREHDVGKAAEPSILLMTVTRKVIYDWGQMEVQESIPILHSYLNTWCLLLTNLNNIQTCGYLWWGHSCRNPCKLKTSLNPRCGECISPTECLPVHLRSTQNTYFSLSL